jgi:hypothetical protein
MFVQWLKVMLPDKTFRSRERQKSITSAGSSVYTIGMKSLPSLITMLIKNVRIFWKKNLRGTFRLLLFLYGFLLICDHDVQGWKEEGGLANFIFNESQGCVVQKFAIFYNASINVLLYSLCKKTLRIEKSSRLRASTPDEKNSRKGYFQK